MAPYDDALKDRSVEFEWDLGKASRSSKSTVDFVTNARQQDLRDHQREEGEPS
jgi:hypothetical protein